MILRILDSYGHIYLYSVIYNILHEKIGVLTLLQINEVTYRQTDYCNPSCRGLIIALHFAGG